MKSRLNLVEIDSEVKIKLSRKRLCPTDSVKYLGIRINENLNWKHHVTDTATKLNTANALLLKIRNFANVNTLKTIYYAIFDHGTIIRTRITCKKIPL